MASGRIRGITIEIGGDTTKLVSSLKNVDTQIKNTQNVLKDVNKLLKMDPGNTELLRQKQKALTDAIGQTKDRLTQLQDAQSQVARGSAEWDALQREIIETEQNLQGLEKEMKDFGSVTAQKLQVVGQKFQEVGGKIEEAGQKLSKISGLAMGALGGIAKLGYDAVTAADDLNTLSKQTGVSTDQLQKWSYASDLVDVSVETMTGSMRKMKKQLDSNEEGFKDLGVRTRDNYGNMRDSVDIFYDTLTALSKIDNETERDIAAMDLFGKSADDLAGIIDDGGKALRDYGREAQQMGLIIDGDTLNKLNDANDTIDKLKATMGASFAQAGATIAQTFAPALEKVAEVVQKVAEGIRSLTPEQTEMIVKILAVVAALSPVLIIVGKLVQSVQVITSVIAALGAPITIIIAAIAALVAAFVYFYNTNEEFRDKVNGIIEQIKQAFASFIEFITPLVQQVLEFIQPILESLQGYLAACIEFFGAIGQAIFAWVEQTRATLMAFYEEHKATIDTILGYITTLVQTKFEIIRTVIKTVIDVITNIVKAFTAILKGDWTSAMQFLQAAATTAINGVQNIFKTLRTNLGNIFKDLISKFKQWGADMISNLIQGIKDKFQSIRDTFVSLGDIIREYIHFSVPDRGPLADFDTYAPDMMKLFAQGIRDNAYLITDAIGSSFDLRPYLTTMNSGIDRLNRTATSSADLQAAQGPVVVNVTLQGDAERMFRVMCDQAHKDWQITGQSRLMGY